jgi:hypothetical protein
LSDKPTEIAKRIRREISQMEIIRDLDSFRMFRHLAHNIYTFNLDPRRIKTLIEQLSGAVALVCRDLSVFADFLDGSL